MFSGRLHVPCYLQTLTGASSGLRANLVSCVSITLPQSDTVRFTCSLHHFNLAPLVWTDKRTQTCCSREYRPFMFSLRRTEVVDIVYLLAAATIHIKHVEVNFWFHLATTELHRSFKGVVTLGRSATSFRTDVCLIWNSFYSCKMTEWWMPKKKATSFIECPASMHPTARQLSEYFINLLEAKEDF